MNPVYLFRYMAITPFQWARTVFRHRSLFKEFFVREIYGRFAGSMGGSLWLIVNPLSQIIIFTFVFSKVMRMRLSPAEVGTDSFVIFLLAGLFPWMAFSEGLTRCTGILVDNANIITKVVMPLEMLPAVGLSGTFFLKGLGMVLYMFYLVWSGFLSWTWLWFPLLIMLFFLFSLGLAAFTAALCVFLRDTQQILTIIIQAWFYLTPILYPMSMVPERFRVLVGLNPVHPFIELFRQVLIRHTLEPALLGQAAAWTAASLFFGVFFFERLKHSFADVL